MPVDDKWHVSKGTRDLFVGVQDKNEIEYNKWQETFASWRVANPALAKQLQNAIDDNVLSAEEMFESIPQTNAGAEATRVSGANAIQQISKLVPH